MKRLYLGVDVGSISTKGVVIDDDFNITAEEYLWTYGNPINAVKELVGKLASKSGGIYSVGTTGSARRLAGAMLDANIVKNEITAHAIGTTTVFPNAATIFEIGGQDSKIILLENGIVTDYAMNTLCAAGTGAFLSSQAVRLGVEVEHFGEMALSSARPASIAARCTVFAESDLVHKAQVGYKKEDIVAGLCTAVASNFLNNLAKGKRICAPIVFQGGVSKNIGVVNAFKRLVGQDIHVDSRGHLMGALGAAVLSMQNGRKSNMQRINGRFETRGGECKKCDNNCELISVFCDGKIVDIWGNRCENGAMSG